MSSLWRPAERSRGCVRRSPRPALIWALASIVVSGVVLMPMADAQEGDPPAGLRGDLNCDGQITLTDVDAFVVAVLTPQAWCQQYGHDMAYLLTLADFDGDGQLTANDIVGFTEALLLAYIPSEEMSVMMLAQGGEMDGDPPSGGFVNLHIDSDNNNGTGHPEYCITCYEDSIEDDPNEPGKYIQLQGGIGDCVPLLLEIHPTTFDPNCAANPNCTNNYCLAYEGYDTNIVIYRDPNLYTTLSSCDPNASPPSIAHRASLLGDMNCDGAVSLGDITAFVTALSGRSAYQAQYPNCNFLSGDFNFDGGVNFSDLNPFIACLSLPPAQWQFVPVRLWVKGRTQPHLDEPLHITAYASLGGNLLSDTVQVRVGDCCSDNIYDPYGYLPGYGQHCADPNTPSRCWGALDSCPLEAPSGFPLNISPAQGFGPADLPPRNLDPALSSTPLVSQPTAYYSLNPHAERATVAGVVDCVTGMPLLQDIDFELPFGGAVFRHVRTYSENFVDHLKSRTRDLTNCFSAGGSHEGGDGPDGTYWDWNGRFWMMSESPILLIDAAYHDLADWKSNSNDPNSPGYGVQMCYFIPDAHHAVPFIDQTGDGNYVAPAWFDAVLRHNGAKSGGQWTLRPTQFEITTQRGTVTYAFQPHYEDLWQYRDGQNRLIDANAHPKDPNTPGFGVPYYGLVTEIRDQYGHRIEYVYATDRYFDCHEENFSDPNDLPGGDDGFPCCDRCCQNCNEKGQVRAIKLHLPPTDQDPNGPVAWTLLYTYRTFGGARGSLPATDVLHQTMLHSIHAYEGDVALPAEPLTVRFEQYFAALDSFDAYDAIEHPSLPSGWRVRAKYTYQEYNDFGSDSIYMHAPAEMQYGRFWAYVWGMNPANTLGGYALLKASTTRRTPNTVPPDTTSTEHMVYRYAKIGCNYGESTSGGQHLRSVWSANKCQRILACLDPNTSANELIVKDATETVALDPNWSCSFADSADMTFWRAGDSSLESQKTTVEYLAPYVSAALHRLVWSKRGTFWLTDRRSNDRAPRTYIFTRLQVWPDGRVPSDPNSGPSTYDPNFAGDCGQFWGDHAPFHWPYRWVSGGNRDDAVTLPAHEPFHIMSVEIYDPNGGVHGGPNYVSSWQHRVVEMNGAGLVLSDKTRQAGAAPQEIGFGEHRIYDGKGRTIMLGSKGWDSAENTDRPNQGLVHVFDYDDAPNGRAGELYRVGVRRGLGSLARNYEDDIPQRFDDAVVTQIIWHDSERPELVTADIKYPTPGDPNCATWYAYTFKDPNDRYSAILSKTITKPPTQRTQGGPLLYPIEKYVNDQCGRTQWVGIGSRTEEGSMLEFYVSYTGYNEFGQPIRNVVDAVPYEQGVPAFPPGWARVSTTAPLQATTLWDYDTTYGLTHVLYPNGRENYTVYKPDPNKASSMFIWEYCDVVYDEGVRKLLSPIKITHVDSGQVLTITEVRKSQPANYPPDGTETYSDADIISVTSPSYTGSGRVSGVEKSAGGESLAAKLSYFLGDLVSRQEGPDGTITRYTYDEFSRLQRTFRGTKDGHIVWGGTCDAPDPNCDNMVLTEKRYYGDGVNDADEVTRVRHFRDRPVNQYLRRNPDGSWPPELIPNEDQIGWTTDYLYDWRMRPVWQIEHDPNGQAYRHTLTLYDNIDRPVVVAEFGPSANAGTNDPNSLALTWPQTGQSESAAQDLLGTGATAVTENIYNLRGQVEEARQWRLVNGDPAYTATLTYYDHGGRPVEVRAPNAPIQTYVYDAKGRQVLSTSQAGGFDVVRTQTVYDNDDRAITTIQSELDPSASDPNGVYINTYVHNWYDGAGRVIATANYGTNAMGFSTGAPEPNRPYGPPTEAPAGALYTRYGYDAAGHQNLVRHPDGTETQSLYDDLGRLRLTTENATSIGGSMKRRTAYNYDDRGRLSAMAAVGNGYTAPINLETLYQVFSNTSTNVQVTEFDYDAVVYPAAWSITPEDGGYGSGWSEESRNNSWISKVTYPSDDPNAGDTLEFAYYSDGSVAWRRDSKGTEFFHQYDGLGRRTDTWIDDYLYNVHALPEAWEPEDRIHHVHYTYDPQGRLETVTAYGWTDSEVIAQNHYEYDTRDNLTSEQQAHAGQATRQIDYVWDFSPQDKGHNHNRLAGIIYPTDLASRRVALDMEYGTVGGLDDALNRVKVLTDVAQGGLGQLAQYAYVGTGRRVSTALGVGDHGVIRQSFGTAASYPGLDRFGRVTDLHFTSTSDATIHRYQYGYDNAGNRLFARATQATLNGASHDNDRSFVYYYDALSRLYDAQSGRPTSTTRSSSTGAIGAGSTSGWSQSGPARLRRYHEHCAWHAVGVNVCQSLESPSGRHPPPTHGPLSSATKGLMSAKLTKPSPLVSAFSHLQLGNAAS